MASRASAFDTLSWTVQTAVRQVTEGIGWRFLQWFERAPKSSNSGNQWAEVLFWLLRGLGLVLLAILIYFMAKQLWRWLQSPQWSKRSRPRPIAAPAVTSRARWLAIAQQAQQAQDYRRAFEALYHALLLQLHESGLLLQDAARTDREYIRGLDQLWSVSNKPLALREDWVTLFETHEWLCFGGAELQGERFAQCQSAYQNLIPYLEVR
jgi:hypothetical protein